MIVGIDPGKSGGLAAIDGDGGLIDGIRMPLLQHGKRDLVDVFRIWDWADDTHDGVRPEAFDRIVLEQVNAMPGQGVTSMFNFGRHTGSVEAYALSTGKPVVWVTPQKWKGYFGLSKDKMASLDRARLEFGDSPLWRVKANDGIAEAALIALWSLRQKA